MRRATAVVEAGGWPTEQAVAEITLAFEDRHRRRLRLIDDAGAPFILDLAKAVRMGDGDGLVLEGGGVIRVRAAVEPVADVSAPTAADRVRLAWHTGNRHAPIQILADGGFRIRDDHVLVAMLIGMGATVVRASAPFSPEPGAYETAASHDHARHA